MWVTDTAWLPTNPKHILNQCVFGRKSDSGMGRFSFCSSQNMVVDQRSLEHFDRYSRVLPGGQMRQYKKD